MSLVSHPSVSDTTHDSNLVASEIRRYERESYGTLNSIFSQSQVLEQLVYSQFQFGYSSRANNPAIQCGATQVRPSISSSIENAAAGSDIERNFSLSDISSTKLLIAKKDRRKFIVLGLFGFVGVLLSFIIPAIVFLPRSENVCNTQACLLESAKKIGKMNQQVKP